LVAVHKQAQGDLMTIVLEAKGLNKSFGAVTAANDINVAVEQDAVVGLIGSNGAGKTTFINMVTGYLKPNSGTIAFGGRDITQFSPRQITRLGICRSFQIPQLFNTLSVYDNLLVGIGVVISGGKNWSQASHHVGTAGEAVDGMLERFKLTGYRDNLAGVLPEGIRKLLDIAMAMAVKPTSGVSADEKFTLMDMVMEAVRAQKVTVLFVEHDMEIVTRYTQRVLAFYEGRIIADGLPAAVIGDSEVRKYVTGEVPQAAAGGHHAAH
jgi:branched-chain amino acid transport system ATP-binding protein